MYVCWMWLCDCRHVLNDVCPYKKKKRTNFIITITTTYYWHIHGHSKNRREKEKNNSQFFVDGEDKLDLTWS